MDCISEQDLDEMNVEIIRNTLYKVHFTEDNIVGFSTSRSFSFISQLSSINFFRLISKVSTIIAKNWVAPQQK